MELSRKRHRLRQANLMFDVSTSCSILQLAKLPFVTRESPSLTGLTLVAETDPWLRQTACSIIMRPLPAWMMQSLNLQSQGLELVLTVLLLAEGKYWGASK